MRFRYTIDIEDSFPLRFTLRLTQDDRLIHTMSGTTQDTIDMMMMMNHAIGHAILHRGGPGENVVENMEFKIAGEWERYRRLERIATGVPTPEDIATAAQEPITEHALQKTPSRDDWETFLREAAPGIDFSRWFSDRHDPGLSTPPDESIIST